MDGLENCIRDSAKVIGVDEHDCQIGAIDKRDAHRSGSPLHRAVSIFIFNEKGEVLVQQRSMEKEIAPGMWSNTCCAHPRPGQDTLEAAMENLKFEAGIVCSLKEVCTMRLSEDLGNGNAWNEMDHIFVGRYYENPIPNPHEVGKMQWIPIKELRQDMSTRPEKYSGVLKNALEIAVKFDQAQMVGKIRAKAKNM